MTQNSVQRPFLLLDAMVLLAATAAGLAIALRMENFEAIRIVTEAAAGGSLVAIGRAFTLWTILGVPLLVAWTITLLIMIVFPRPSRPNLDDVLRRPGATACGAAAAAIAISLINAVPFLSAFVSRSFRNGAPPFGQIVYTFDTQFLFTVGFDFGAPGLAVAAVWSMQTLSGRWLPESNWLDQTGRAVGWVWIILKIIQPWVLSTQWGFWS